LCFDPSAARRNGRAALVGTTAVASGSGPEVEEFGEF